MCDRPDVPKAIREQLLFEVRYHCAADCAPVALEMAHIRQMVEGEDPRRREYGHPLRELSHAVSQ